MENQKFWINQKLFRKKVAKLSKHYCFEIVVKPMGLGIWAWTCPYWVSTAIHRWSWHSKEPRSVAMAILWRPSLSIVDNEKKSKFWKIPSSWELNVHFVKMKEKWSYETKLSRPAGMIWVTVYSKTNWFTRATARRLWLHKKSCLIWHWSDLKPKEE